MARFDGELVEETKPKFSGEAVTEKKKETPEPPKSLMQRVKQFGESVLGGTVMGAVTPELTMGAGAALSAIPTPYTRAVGTGLGAAGRAMRGERMAAAGAGALAGGTGDVAGQTVEIQGGSPPAVFLGELAGGIVGPAFVNTISKAIQYGTRKLLGLDPISAIKTVASDLNIDEASLTPTQKQYIKEQVEKLRGGPASTASQEKLYGELQKGAQTITSDAQQRAAQAKAEGLLNQFESEQKAQKMSLAGKKTEDIGAKALQEAQNARSNIGTEREVSNIGEGLRDRIVKLFGDIADRRSQAYNAQKQIRDTAVAEKETAGQLVKDMPEYKALLTDLRSKLLIGPEAQTQKTAPVTEKGVLQAYQNIYDAVTARRVQVGVNEEGNPVFKTFPTSFDALDDVRRRLGDVAFGKDVEGYSAIGSSIAKKYYAKISELQSKFAGEAHDDLQSGYEMASRLLDKYKSKVGKKATAEDRFDPTRFMTDPASLPKNYFQTKQSVQDLIDLTGGDKGFVIQNASDFAARELKNKTTATTARNWLNNNTDWLNALPEVRGKVEAYVKALERGERIAGKSKTAQDILGVRAPALIREGERAVKAGETEAGKITGEAQDRVKTILGDRNPAARITEIILSGRPSIWKEVGPILSGSPEGKKHIADAVNQVLANRVQTGLVSSIKAFREDVRPSLEAANLMSKSQLDNLESTLQSIASTVTGEEAKLTAMQKAIKNALIGVISQPVGAGSVGLAKLLTPKSALDVLNKKDSVATVQPRFK